MQGGEYMRNLLQGLLKIIYEKPINWGGGGFGKFRYEFIYMCHEITKGWEIVITEKMTSLVIITNLCELFILI